MYYLSFFSCKPCWQQVDTTASRSLPTGQVKTSLSFCWCTVMLKYIDKIQHVSSTISTITARSKPVLWANAVNMCMVKQNPCHNEQCDKNWTKSSPWTLFPCSPFTVGKKWGGTHSRIMKGWVTSVSTSFSLWTCCSCFSRMTSGIFICFRA